MAIKNYADKNTATHFTTTIKNSVMHCPHCNEENIDTAKFCKNCGQPLKNSTVQDRVKTDGTKGRNVVIALLVAGVLLPGYYWRTHTGGQLGDFLPDFTCGAASVQDADGILYGTVVAEDGRCWLDRNLGASQVATSPTDEASYGWYFQWGRGADGHQLQNSGTTSTFSITDTPGHDKFITHINNVGENSDWRSPSNSSLWQEVVDNNNPCPADFRVPTEDEWSLLETAATITNSTTAFNSLLKLPLAGYRGYWGGVDSRPDSGNYWSSTPSQGNYAMYFQISDGLGNGSGYGNGRVWGYSVRCIRDTDAGQLQDYPLVGELPIQARLYTIHTCQSELYPNDDTKIAICVSIQDEDLSNNAPQNQQMTHEDISKYLQNKYSPYVNKQIKGLGFDPNDYEMIYEES